MRFHYLLTLALTGTVLSCGDESGSRTTPAEDTAEDTAEEVQGVADVMEPTGDLPVEDVRTVETNNGSPPEDVPDSGSTPESDTQTEPDPDTQAGPDLTVPTWFQCRRAFLTGALTPALKALCDDWHTSEPTQRHYGIRWVFMTDVGDQAAWIADHLKAINLAFGPAEMFFRTESSVTITDPVVTIGVSETEYTITELAPDIRQHLELNTSDPGAILEALKQQLLEALVHPTPVENLSLDTAWTPQPFLQTMARAHPEAIHVMVLPKVNTSGAGGMSSGPGPTPTNPRVSVVNLRGDPSVSVVALPHEFGHFFGLKHPHGAGVLEQAEVPFDFEKAVKQTPVEGDLVAKLAETLGSTYENQLPPLYGAYDLPFAELKSNDESRFAIAQLVLARHHTYRHGSDGPQAFEGLADFVEAGLEKEALYRKNFTLPPSPDDPTNNCTWREELAMLGCDIGDPAVFYPGTDPFVAGSIILDDGQRANIMSYIAKTLEPTLDDLQVRFTSEQIKILHIHANTPVRQLLKRHEPPSLE